MLLSPNPSSLISLHYPALSAPPFHYQDGSKTAGSTNGRRPITDRPRPRQQYGNQGSSDQSGIGRPVLYSWSSRKAVVDLGFFGSLLWRAEMARPGRDDLLPWLCCTDFMTVWLVTSLTKFSHGGGAVQGSPGKSVQVYKETHCNLYNNVAWK